MSAAHTLKHALTSAATSSLSVRVFRDSSELAMIADAWDDLVFRVTARPPMLSHAWVSAHLEHRLRTDTPWFCLSAFEGGKLVGVLPLEERPMTVLGRRVRMLCQPGDPHTHSVDAVIVPGCEHMVIEAFREALDRESPGWFGLRMERLDESSVVVDQHLALPHSRILCSPAGSASVVRTVGGWDEYRSGLSHNFRRQLKKAQKKLGDVASVEPIFLSGSQAHPDYLNRFIPIEAAGWKGRAHSAIGADAGLTRFYRALAERLYRRGTLEWHFLQADGQLIAGHLAIRSGRTLTIWKIGYCEEYADYSPGVLLMEQTIARAFKDDSTDEVNFVTDKDWHNHWQPRKRLYHDVWIYPTRLSSIIAGVWPKQFREGLRRVPGLRSAVRAFRLVRNRTTASHKTGSQGSASR